MWFFLWMLWIAIKWWARCRNDWFASRKIIKLLRKAWFSNLFWKERRSKICQTATEDVFLIEKELYSRVCSRWRFFGKKHREKWPIFRQLVWKKLKSAQSAKLPCKGTITELLDCKQFLVCKKTRISLLTLCKTQSFSSYTCGTERPTFWQAWSNWAKLPRFFWVSLAKEAFKNSGPLPITNAYQTKFLFLAICKPACENKQPIIRQILSKSQKTVHISSVYRKVNYRKSTGLQVKLLDFETVLFGKALKSVPRRTFLDTQIFKQKNKSFFGILAKKILDLDHFVLDKVVTTAYQFSKRTTEGKKDLMKDNFFQISGKKFLDCQRNRFTRIVSNVIYLLRNLENNNLTPNWHKPETNQPTGK